jgi:hypothetical protein
VHLALPQITELKRQYMVCGLTGTGAGREGQETRSIAPMQLAWLTMLATTTSISQLINIRAGI